MRYEETLRLGVCGMWAAEDQDWTDWNNAVEQLELELKGGVNES